MEAITWDDVRVGQYLIIRQVVPRKGPRLSYRIEWGGKVVEHNAKQTLLKQNGTTMSVPQKWGDEEILKMGAKDFNAYIKENHG